MYFELSPMFGIIWCMESWYWDRNQEDWKLKNTSYRAYFLYSSCMGSVGVSGDGGIDAWSNTRVLYASMTQEWKSSKDKTNRFPLYNVNSIGYLNIPLSSYSPQI